MDTLALFIGIVGGVGLGLLLGSEFSGTYCTIAGAVLVVISIILMFVFNLKIKLKS